MEFDINNYPGEVVMHCPEEWMAELFCNFLHKNGMKWCTGVPYINKTNYDKYGENTTYSFNTGQICYMDYFKSKGYTVLEFADFDFGTTDESVAADDLDTEIIDMYLAQFSVRNDAV